MKLGPLSLALLVQVGSLGLVEDELSSKEVDYEFQDYTKGDNIGKQSLDYSLEEKSNAFGGGKEKMNTGSDASGKEVNIGGTGRGVSNYEKGITLEGKQNSFVEEMMRLDGRGKNTKERDQTIESMMGRASSDERIRKNNFGEESKGFEVRNDFGEEKGAKDEFRLNKLSDAGDENFAVESMKLDGMDFGKKSTILDGEAERLHFLDGMDDDFGRTTLDDDESMLLEELNDIKLDKIRLRGDDNLGMRSNKNYDFEQKGVEESYDSSEEMVSNRDNWLGRDDDSFNVELREKEHEQVFEEKDGGKQEIEDEWNLNGDGDNEDPDWKLTDSDINFSQNMARKGKMHETVEKWDTAEDDLIKIGGEKTLNIVDKEWKSNDIADMKVQPISFTEGYNFKKKWRELSKSNVIDDLQAMADLQWKIISTLKKIEHTSKNNNDCNLQQVYKQIAAVEELDESLDAQKPFVSDTELRQYLVKRRFDRSVAGDKLNEQQDEIIEELNRFKMMDELADRNKPEEKAKISIPKSDLCDEVRKREKELQDASKQLRLKVTERRKNVLKILNNLVSSEGHDLDADLEPMTVRVAGTVNEERCARCEELDNEEVCGDNGKTYRTLCHAVNCAGLALKDISVGSCAAKDVCAKAECPINKLCIPMNQGTCLSLYSSDGLRKLPCRQYICVDSRETCDQMNFTEVCGTDHKTYNSLCTMHKAGAHLAYTGPCRSVCKGEVCGIDKNTYLSACHARTHNVKVDYSGKCYSKKSIGELLVPTCTAVRLLGRCHKEALCNKPVLPLDICCPICGGVAQIRLDIAALSDFISNHEEKNHLFVLENMLREMLPPYAVQKCDVLVSLTNSGNISLILEAVNPGDNQLCQDATLSVTNSIESGITHPGSNEMPRNVDTPRKFEMAAFLSVDSWLRNQVVEVQDTILDSADDFRNEADVKLSDTLLTVDDEIQELPSKGSFCTVSNSIVLHALTALTFVQLFTYMYLF